MRCRDDALRVRSDRGGSLGGRIWPCYRPGNLWLPRSLAARREHRAPSPPTSGATHEVQGNPDRRRGSRARRLARHGAEDHLHAQLGRRRRSCALFLRAEDGLVQTGRHRRRFRDRPRLGRLGAEGRRRRLAARPLRHGRRAPVPRQGRRSGRRDERLRQLAAGPVLAQELGHQGRAAISPARRSATRRATAPARCGRRWRSGSASIRRR